MYFVEDNLVGVTNAPETGQEGQSGDDGEGDPIAQLRVRSSRFPSGFADNFNVGADTSSRLGLLLGGASDIALAQAALRTRHGDGRRSSLERVGKG